jgi:hypothetical protein
VLPCGQTLTLGILATFTLEVVLFRSYAQLPVLLPFCKCILEVIFCEGVQYRLQFYIDDLNCVKMAEFQIYLQSGKQKSHRGPSQASRIGGDDSFVCLFVCLFAL